VRIGTSLLLIAVGLVFAYAVDFELPGIEIGTLGSILFFVGLLGLAVSVGLEVMDGRARRPPRPRPEPARPPAAQERPEWDPVMPARGGRSPSARPRDPADDETRRLR